MRSLISLDTVTFQTKGNVGGWAMWVDQCLRFCGHYSSLEELPGMADVCVAEKPKYRGRESDVDPQDLIQLSWDACRAADYSGRHVIPVEPNEWKGQLPKHVVEVRVRKRLSPYETQVLNAALSTFRAGWHHNTIEAVGLGLWQLGRL